MSRRAAPAPADSGSPEDRLFAALAHPVRRRILDLLVQAPGSNVTAVASHFDLSRIAVMKHLATLEHADLVLSEVHGRSRRLYFNPLPIQRVYDRWTTQYSSFWAERMSDIRARVEARGTRRKKHA